MLRVTDSIFIPLSDIQFTAIRSQGPGGQNVNKVASAIQLRFDIEASSLPEFAKARLIHFSDSRISSDGHVVIKAQTHRVQARNKTEALERLTDLIRRALYRPKVRRATRPSRRVNERRLKRKAQRGQLKSSRGRVKDFD